VNPSATVPLAGFGGAYVRASWQLPAVLTLAQVKLLDVLLQPAGKELNPEVTDKAVAGLPSSVANETVSDVLLPVMTASEVGFGAPTTLSLVVARYGTAIEPLFDSPASFR
jgi:hypothetical protein